MQVEKAFAVQRALDERKRQDAITAALLTIPRRLREVSQEVANVDPPAQVL